ncbi:hypothetical protein CROQUDRAFT_661063 [Cronartium quercuum f. sp. fusiforme G11]|uniref:Uncharacterized protein n=1 Tax=Cronartium quercuum f. sp. fusiforme G11 TaxID=708437 RepID=A0A9P6NG16_9BASI|nr:hypothetical protein CROQUDRAFT_661063 [Cronartium quercuum f. sp. fusiforme G11]
MHDSIGTESTTVSERSSRSRICRRNLRSWLLNPFGRSARPESPAVASRTHERQGSTVFHSLTNAVSEEYHVIRHQLLYNFETLRSDWNLGKFVQ